MNSRDKKTFRVMLVTILIMSICITFMWLELRNSKTPIIENQVVVDYTNYMLAISEIKKYDIFKNKAYKENGKFYVGYGFATSDSNATISRGIADMQLHVIYKNKILWVNKTYGFTGDKALAVANLVYRWGRGNLVRSQLHQELKRNDFIGIVREWNVVLFAGEKHDQIFERNELELRLFFN